MTTGAEITYRIGNDIPLDVARALYEASTLGARRPIDEPATFAAVDYYPTIGFTHHPQAWMLAGTDPFPSTGN